MQKPLKPLDEPERQKALDSYDLLDTDEEKIYDDLTKLASEICQVPIALVSLIIKTGSGLNPIMV